MIEQQQTKVLVADTPRITKEEADDWIRYTQPVWQMAPDATVTAANLLAFWLWGALRPSEETIQPNELLGENVLSIIGRPHNLARIPMAGNRRFFEIKSAVAKRLDTSSVAYFVEAMQGQPELREIYEQAEANPQKEWEYTLRISAPQINGTGELLRFATIVSEIYRDGELCGYLARYRPVGETRALVRQQYKSLVNLYGTMGYVQRIDKQVGDFAIKEQRIESEFSSNGERLFADIKAKIAWDIAQAVDRVVASLPPESQRLNAHLITFDPENARRGRYALFFSGTVIGTDQKGVFQVPDRSLLILQALHIPYRLVSPSMEAA